MKSIVLALSLSLVACFGLSAAHSQFAAAYDADAVKSARLAANDPDPTRPPGFDAGNSSARSASVA